jgi:hypothetical protein
MSKEDCISKIYLETAHRPKFDEHLKFHRSSSEEIIINLPLNYHSQWYLYGIYMVSLLYLHRKYSACGSDLRGIIEKMFWRLE